MYRDLTETAPMAPGRGHAHRSAEGHINRAGWGAQRGVKHNDTGHWDNRPGPEWNVGT